MRIARYNQFGGRHSETAALRNVLAHLGVVAPHSHEPFTEEMLFGIGGGIGTAYFAFDFKHRKALYLGTRVHTKETDKPEFLQGICDRIGAGTKTVNSSSLKASENHLKKALLEGHTPILWADQGKLPYYAKIGTANFYHTIVVYGIDEEKGEVEIADRSLKPMMLTLKELSEARNSDWAPKLRAFLVSPPEKVPELREAVLQGIRHCCEQMLNPPIANLGLKGLVKWADLLTHAKDKKGWAKFFPPGGSLFHAMVSVFNQIENRGNGGGAFRTEYADFLIEAVKVVRKSRLSEVADLFRTSANLWSKFASSLLPDSVESFKEIKKLSSKKRVLFETKGSGALQEMKAINLRLLELNQAVDQAFPLGPQETSDLLADLREQVLGIHRLEEQAIHQLQELASTSA